MTTGSRTLPTKDNPRGPQLDRDAAHRLAATEYQRVATMLTELSPEQWAAPTDCPPWDVRAMAGHMLGMMQMVATISQLARQQVTAARHVKRDGVELVDALTALQVERNSHLSTRDLVAQVRLLGPRAARNRSRAPGFVRKQTMPDKDERWTLGYLFDVILTRDPFLHRIDISRATGVAMTASADHEGVLVADVVAEWADRHGAPYELELTGPAGGHWTTGSGEKITMDALEFCRALSGRARTSGLLGTQVPF